MSCNAPAYKPLHRVRQMRNAARNAALFPQLREELFTPTDISNPRYDVEADLIWSENGGGLYSVMSRTSPPQPTMEQYYRPPFTQTLRPIPFADDEAREAHIRGATERGFVSAVSGGHPQLKRMLRAGLDPRKPVPPAELRRRAAHEARVQRFRNAITPQDIIDESRFGVEGRRRARAAPQAAFPGLDGLEARSAGLMWWLDEPVDQPSREELEAAEKAKAEESEEELRF